MPAVIPALSGCSCRLAKKRTAEKRLAITVFSFPPDKGNVGTAAYLNVFGSIFRVLQDLQQQGYDVGKLPESSDQLIQSVRDLPVHSTGSHLTLLLMEKSQHALHALEPAQHWYPAIAAG